MRNPFIYPNLCGNHNPGALKVTQLISILVLVHILTSLQSNGRIVKILNAPSKNIQVPLRQVWFQVRQYFAFLTAGAPKPSPASTGAPMSKSTAKSAPTNWRTCNYLPRSCALPHATYKNDFSNITLIYHFSQGVPTSISSTNIQEIYLRKRMVCTKPLVLIDYVKKFCESNGFQFSRVF